MKAALPAERLEALASAIEDRVNDVAEADGCGRFLMLTPDEADGRISVVVDVCFETHPSAASPRAIGEAVARAIEELAAYVRRGSRRVKAADYA